MDPPLAPESSNIDYVMPSACLEILQSLPFCLVHLLCTVIVVFINDVMTTHQCLHPPIRWTHFGSCAIRSRHRHQWAVQAKPESASPFKARRSLYLYLHYVVFSRAIDQHVLPFVTMRNLGSTRDSRCIGQYKSPS